MPTIRQEPFFNLKAVVQQTGLKPDTLRAWERRYGLPTPERSKGGHRLYSQKDIETIKWLLARQQEGLSISHAVELWTQIRDQGQNPLYAPLPLTRPTTPSPLPKTSGGTIEETRQQWIDACLAYDEQQAEQLMNQAFALYSPETVTIELLQKAVAQIGDGWYRGEVTVQQEHFCSSLVIRRLESLVMAAPPPLRPGRILAACPPKEQHVIGLLLLTFLLRRRGWEVIYLSANVPIEQLKTTVSTIQPQLVIMAAQVLQTAAQLQKAAQVLQAAGVPLAYGGLVFNLLPALRPRIAGHFLGEQIVTVPQIVESLMTAPRPIPTPAKIPDEYTQALQNFERQQNLIEAKITQALHSAGHTHNHLALANRELGQNIKAALALGDMDLIGTGIEWVTGLLKNHDLPIEILRHYLHTYRQVAAGQLGEQGRPVVDWLDKLMPRKDQDR